jgi:RNA polymerase sigma-70 factor (ECF subfamily)
MRFPHVQVIASGSFNQSSPRETKELKMNEPISAEEFETAALPHLNDLFRTARHVIGDGAQAEDLVQETYLQAWKSFHRFEAGTNCRAWLFKILFHVISHHRRKWYKWSRTAAEDDTLEQTLPYEPPIPQQLTDEDVLSAFERIPSQYREVVLLADVEEFSYKEVAETLNIPLGTVMSRLSRGRKLLREQLTDFAESYGVRKGGAAVATGA